MRGLKVQFIFTFNLFSFDPSFYLICHDSIIAILMASNESWKLIINWILNIPLLMFIFLQRRDSQFAPYERNHSGKIFFSFTRGSLSAVAINSFANAISVASES